MRHAFARLARMDLSVVKGELAPSGVLRAGISAANKLLVSKPDIPDGVSPSVAKAIAEKIGAEVELVQYKTPGDIAGAPEGEWDICLIGADPARAGSISFTAAYAEIQAGYLVMEGSAIQSLEEVDKPGVKIAAIPAAASAPAGGRILDGHYMSVQQAVGCRSDKTVG